MKRYISVNTYLLVAIVGCFIALSTCTEDEGSDPDPKGNLNGNPNDSTNTNNDNDPNTAIDANAISDNLILKDFTAINGSIPASSNLADLKLDKDAIFLVEGIKNRIRILYPPNFATGSSSVYIQVAGADQYFDVPLEEEESSDTVGVFYLEFDPDDWEPPFSFNIKIAPHDDSGTPIDESEKEVVVEKKGDFSCSPSSPEPHWDWIWTTIDGNINSAPGHGRVTEGAVNGCCLEGYTVDCIANGLPESEWISLDYVSTYRIEYEVLHFTTDLQGGLMEITQNIDPSESDFCNGEPGYVYSFRDHLFWGDYTYNPSNGQVQLSNLESRSQEIYLDAIDLTVTEYDKYFISPDFLYEIISCHFLMETSSVEGQSRIRLFERRKGEGDTWYD